MVTNFTASLLCFSKNAKETQFPPSRDKKEKEKLSTLKMQREKNESSIDGNRNESCAGITEGKRGENPPKRMPAKKKDHLLDGKFANTIFLLLSCLS